MLSLNSAICLESPKAQSATEAKISVDVTMGNQQATREEIGWLAGLIDGEGYLGISFQRDKRRVHGISLDPHLHITNTDEVIILKGQAILRKLGINPYIRAVKANSKTKKDQYVIQTKHLAKLEKLLVVMEPYLTGQKQERARLVLKFIALRKKSSWFWTRPENKTGQGGARKPYSQEELDIAMRCRDLQRRGASETVRRARRLTSEIWQLMKARQQGCREDTVPSHMKV